MNSDSRASPAPAKPAPKRFQFRIAHLLALTTAVAVMLWSFPWIHGDAWIEGAVKIVAASFFAAFGLFFSACGLFSLFPWLWSLFTRRSPCSARVWQFVGLVIIGVLSYSMINIAYETHLELGDWFGGWARWIIAASAVVGAVSFVVLMFLPNSPQRSSTDESAGAI